MREAGLVIAAILFGSALALAATDGTLGPTMQTLGGQSIAFFAPVFFAALLIYLLRTR